MAEMIEVVIDSIRVGLMSQNRVIILRELGFGTVSGDLD